MKNLYKLIFCTALLALAAAPANAQINELRATPVYDYLYRMAQKGIVEWPDWQTPLQRIQVHNALKQLVAGPERLSKIEAAELRFYLQEYAFDSLDAGAPEKKAILKKDAAGRFRTFSYEKGDHKIFLDPILGGSLFCSGGQGARRYYSGVRVAGYFGKRIGFNLSFRDNTERGDTVDRTRSFTPDEGIVPTVNFERVINYPRLQYNLAYRWSNGSVSVGQDNLTWGYGLGGNVALSGRAPSFPYIKLEYKPWRWLAFTYFHGWLQSNIIDSGRTYPTGTGVVEGVREIYHPKFIAHHAVVIRPVKGLDLAVGESVVYSDQLNIGYLIPVGFFRAFDHKESRYNLKASDNSQFFLMVSSRNQLKKTHVYAQLFIDEIRLPTAFNRTKNRNQLGYTIGVARTDLFLHYLTAGVEYTRINPFVYNNLFPTQTYESHSFGLGDWMGQNADRLYGFLQYNPLPRLTLRAWGQSVRKGTPGPLSQQYGPPPPPPFLSGKLFTLREAGGTVRYEWANRLILFAHLNLRKFAYTSGDETRRRSGEVGFSYNL